MGQLASALSSRPSGSLPSNTEIPKSNGKEHCKAIQLRSGKETASSVRKQNEQVLEKENRARDKEIEVSPKISSVILAPATETTAPKLLTGRLPPPFPQRLKKTNQDKQFRKFLEILKQLYINIPLVEAFEQMPNYVKFMKDILTKKRRFGEFETVALTRECSAVLQNKLPPKLKDPGSFTIPCSIGNQYFGKALCDLGASINLMPMSIFKKLGIGEARPTTISLQLADRSIAHPKGKIEDVLVKVDKFIFPVDFIVLDFEADLEVPIILGRPFLATGRALIDMQNGELTIRVQDEQVTFNLFQSMKFPSDVEECSAISLVDSLVSEQIELCCRNPLQFSLLDSSNLEDDNEEEWAWVETKQSVGKQRMQFEPLDTHSKDFKQPKASINEPPVLELKPLPSHLRYAYLGEVFTLPVIISALLTEEQDNQLLEVLKKFKKAIG
ncbi:hypothetical protein UlMin_009698 [Ulmus minor]